MCIAIYKPAKVNIPSKKVLKTCFKNNPDGAGFAIKNLDGLTYGYKGYMSFSAFWAAFRNYSKGREDTEMIIHFRISTHGLKDGSATHPFPISKEYKDLSALKFVSDKVMAHNGIIQEYGEPEDNKKLSDTQHFIRDILADPAIRDNLLNKAILQILSKSISTSKMIIFTSEGNALIGKFKKVNGVYFSNDSYKESLWNDSYNWHKFDKSFEELYDDDLGECELCGEDIINDDTAPYCNSCHKVIMG